MAQARFSKVSTDLGTYWKSSLPKSALRAELSKKRITKEASLGGEPSSGFESAFASLAYSYVKDRSPRLLDFIVGFQLVDRNEDNTKAAGIFGFKVGDQWLYAPVFFLNGDLKGHELLYVKNRDLFVPNEEGWVNKLISQRPHTLGKGSPQTPHQLGAMTPNLSRLARMPVGGFKYGADAQETLPALAPWAQGVMPLICAAAVKQASALYAGVGDSPLDFEKVVSSPYQAALAAAPIDLAEAVREPAMFKAAQHLAHFYPAIKRGFDRFYGANFFDKARQEIEKNAQCLLTTTKRAESYVLPPKAGKKKSNSISPIKIDAVKEAATKEAAIEVISLDVDEDAPITVNISDEDREKLIRDTVLIKDPRDPQSEKNSIAYNTQIQLNLTNPTESGLYSVLEKPGDFDEMLVLCAPMSGEGKQEFCVVLRKSGVRNWKNIHRTQLWAQCEGHPNKNDFQAYVDKLPGKETLKKDGLYIALNNRGESTCPFRVLHDLGGDTYRVHWEDYCSWRLGRNRSLPALAERREWSPTEYDEDLITFNSREGTKLRLTRGTVSIPTEFKVLKLKDPPKPKEEKGMCGCLLIGETSSGEDAPITPGNLIDVQLMLRKEASLLSIYDTGANEVWLKTAADNTRMPKKAALISLVRDHGLRETQARIMLKEACQKGIHNTPAVYLVKYGFGYGSGSSLQPGPTAPPLPDPLMGEEPVGRNGSVSANYSQEDYVPVDSMASQLGDPSVYDPYYEPDEEAVQVGQQAAGAGQKEVFDTAMFSSMLKSVSQDNMVDKHLGDLMKAVDALGRMLLMFYWHQEEFQDRYGKQDLPELEDGLRNAFEANGKISLFLQEKTVKGKMRGGASMGDSDDVEPGLNEVARN